MFFAIELKTTSQRIEESNLVYCGDIFVNNHARIITDDLQTGNIDLSTKNASLVSLEKQLFGGYPLIFANI